MTIKEFLYVIFEILLVCVIITWIATYSIFWAIVVILFILISLSK